MSLLNTQQIMEIIPHRYPMLMLDTVEELVPGERVVAYKNISINEEIFQGHFPGNPTFPGALTVEALAQAGAVALLSMPEYKGKTAYFGGIKKARYRQMVRPGDRLKLEVNIERLRGPIGTGKGIVWINDKKATTAELTFIIGD
ncbi:MULTISPECIES: 3-hydroxyacyl-ACP dehydratase FabZ [Leuconostoc]|jgi:3-hydroxyacyl-[acyl-carrier-protein] dehydratase|uniref:3-hydroxyacyl-[acyl-carrier-protein] dehydratase FabZ n=2 Tax=Leuconostoc citreum TaxID=33964 RepID=B1MX89_LEUCK|nr:MULTISPECIES: 3-hydroxyacyl-ACP dehydratase FabZ [Leuconostoc]ACA82141.1 (3R)-hydroxymyristoyl-[acyl carrier protein] dehydratase [Leuconostoc citreum KM20]KAF0260274.1 3-hydroxyacyl-[acyl-carrier-protein] dehydratase FabZ [Leuconostoc citreum]MBA5938677.1 3-hydroxyacyl-ACP dehydratase FabZ [Leuconostoc citreum]MBE4726501.1 3-hydroxyacyl-ACP dehydratase FabZ [Leuconostoc citreum]MBU7451307.1 3-hydroxyacyl-ACP dehydratase FabZ [Leuconostoc citreum]